MTSNERPEVAPATAGTMPPPAFGLDPTRRAPDPPAVGAEPPIATILIVAHSDVGRTAVCAYLDDLGYRTVDARTVDEAAVLAANAPIDVIVIDGSMVGPTTVDRLGAPGASVVVTTYPEDEPPAAGHRALAQPITLRGLAAAVRAALAERRH